jgi:hypothetical protein
MLRLDDVTDLDLTFSVTSKSPWGDATTVDLVPDGHDINVNNDNKLGKWRLVSYSPTLNCSKCSAPIRLCALVCAPPAGGVRVPPIWVFFQGLSFRLRWFPDEGSLCASFVPMVIAPSSLRTFPRFTSYSTRLSWSCCYAVARC